MQFQKMERLIQGYKKEGYTERRIKNALAKEEAKEQAQRNQKPIKEITITIEWKKSKTWGATPKAEARVSYQDGTYAHKDGYTCSGCGYDKESTVIAQIFNEFLKYKLWELEGQEVVNKPYGISLNYDYYPYYDGGIGTNCYYRISEFIGGKFQCISSGKSFDVYKFTMN